MTTRLAPYGSAEHAHNLSKVGKEKTPRSLASRMPSPDIVAKVGQKNPAAQSLVARMPSPEIAAKVGGPNKNVTPHSLAARMPSPTIAAKVGATGISGARTHRVIRRNERG